ncbi:MAG: sugar ABC transporter substrate-binding protein [Chloroflexota bacterium]|nr:MAG: sugar ABC transporter substrate-binding protein [Chloroflexota bacterium]
MRLNKGTVRLVSIVVALAAVGSLLLSACSSGQGGSSASSGTVTIEYWDWWVTQGPTIDNEIKLFQEKYPNIRIKKTTQVTDKYPELLQLAFKGGNSPDVFLIPDTPQLNEQVQQGWLMPLNKWASKEWQSTFPATAFAEGSNVLNGKIYTVPYDGPGPWLQLYVNTKLFKEAGLVDANGEVKLPKTWDEVRADAKAISRQGNGKYYGFGFGNKQKFALPWQMMMAQNAGAADAQTGFDARVGQYAWASNPVYGNWIKFFLGMKEDGSIIPNAMSMDDEMARASFADGKFAMLVGGSWNMTGWKKTNPNFQDYAVAQMPYDGQEQASYFYTSPGGKGWAISSQTKHPEETWLWFQWLNSKDAAVRWVQAGQGLRVQPEANQLEYAPTQQFAQFMKLAQNDVKMAPAPGLQHPEMNQVKQQAVQPNIQAILEGLYTGQIKDYKSALQDLEKRQNAELARAIQDAQARGTKLDTSWWTVKDWDLTKDYGPTMATSPNK